MNDTFYKDLVCALGELPSISFDATNPHYKSEYLSLAGIFNAVRPVLRKYNLAIIQDVRTDSASKEVCVRSYLYHASGQKIESSEARFPIPQWTPQGLGSVITYAKRYQVMAMLSIAGQDDDGELAEAPTRKAAKAADLKKKVEILDDQIPF